MRKVKSVEERYRVTLEMPWGTGQVMNFLMGCHQDGLRPNSIRTYLSQVKSSHLVGGLPWEVDMYVPNQILRGMFNTAEPARRRIAVTPLMMTTMFLYIHSLKKSWSLHDRRLVWAVVSTLWGGSFRCSEILSPVESGFLKEEAFSWSKLSTRGGLVDGKWTNWLEIKLLKPKEFREGRSHGVNIELFEVPQALWCPFSAMAAFRKDNKLGEEPGMPVFRWESGRCLTGRALNAFIKLACADLSEYPDNAFLGTHSFRAGIASILGSLGVDEKKIQSVGRWASNAWLIYAKEGRSIRKEDQLRMQMAAAGQFSTWSPVPVMVETEDDVERNVL